MDFECVVLDPTGEELAYVCAADRPLRYFVHEDGLTILAGPLHRDLARARPATENLAALDRISAAVGRSSLVAGRRLRATQLVAMARATYLGGDEDLEMVD